MDRHPTSAVVEGKWLADAGAMPCARCGKPSSLPALGAPAGVNYEGARTCTSMWFCFECGHTEQRPSN